jgi:hypothetical protein
MATTNPNIMRRYNLLATFPDRRAAEEAVGALKHRGLQESAISVGSRDDDRDVANAEMRDELEGLVAGPGVIASKTMSRGSLVGGIIGAVVGAVIGFLVGAAIFGSQSGSSRTIGIAAAVVAFAAGLATAGGVMGGFFKPRYKSDSGDIAPGDTGPAGAPGEPGKPEQSGGQVVVGVHADDERLISESETVLSAANPLRLDLVDSRGQVLNTEEIGLGELPVEPGSGRVRKQEGQEGTA